MRRKTKGALWLLVAVCAVCCMAVACGKPTAEPTVTVTLTAPSEVTVEYGKQTTVPQATAVNQNGGNYSVNFVVYDADKLLVETVSGAFTVTDTRGYTVKYFLTVQDKEYVAYTTVKVVACDIPVSVSGAVTASMPGETVKIGTPKAEHIHGVTFTSSVTFDGHPVEINAGSFVTESAGEYTVTVTAADAHGNAGSYIYTVECMQDTVMNRGLIERFDDGWTAATREEYVVTTTDSEKIASYNGKNTYVAKLDTTSADYITLYCNPMFSKAYYQTLIDDGFDGMTFWIYVQSKNNVTHTLEQHFTRGSYVSSEVTASKHTVYPNAWTQVTLQLSTPQTYDFQRSFIAAYDYLKEQSNWFCHLNNSLQWGDGNGGDTVTLYIGDIYATKTVDTDDFTVNDDIDLTAVSVGDTVDFTRYIENYDATLLLGYGDTTERVDGQYTFAADADYTLTARLTDGCYRSAPRTFNFHVTSDYTLEADTDDLFFGVNGTCNLADLDLTVTAPQGDPQLGTVKYTVTHKGLPVEHTNGVFTYAQNGVYNVTVTAQVKDGATELTVIRNYAVDLSVDGKRIFADASNAANVWQWNYNSNRQNMRHEYKEVTVGGRTGEMLVFKEWAQHVYLQIIPTYSKVYFEKLASLGAVLTFDYYVDCDKWSNRATRLLGESGSGTEQPVKTWYTAMVEVQTIVEKYEKLFLTSGDSTNDMKLAFFWVDDANATVYITPPRIVVYETVETSAYLGGDLFVGASVDLKSAAITCNGVTVPATAVTGYTIVSGSATLHNGVLTPQAKGTVVVAVTYNTFDVDGRGFRAGSVQVTLNVKPVPDGSTPDIFD